MEDFFQEREKIYTQRRKTLEEKCNEIQTNSYNDTYYKGSTEILIYYYVAAHFNALLSEMQEYSQKYLSPKFPYFLYDYSHGMGYCPVHKVTLTKLYSCLTFR